MALAALCLLPMAAQAQSAFTGTVKDTSGAVLPGVTVEAASDALIEKTRSVVTDENGGYRLVDLRPGTYSLTFSLEGFSTVKREAIQLESNFTMTVNTDLKVGALEETLTVTGASPIVDVQSTTKSQVLNREALDAIPTGRTIQGMGQLITGVSLNQPDIGGSKAMQQTYMSAHGAGASQTTVQVDGLMVNGIDVDGAVQNYFNSSMSQEMVYTTSGASADVAGGGVRLNMIPRDGGNTLSGSLFLGYQNESFQSDNVTDDLHRPRPDVRPTASASCPTPKARSAARSRRTSSGSSARRATSCSTRCRPTPSTAFRAPARRPRRRCRAPSRRVDPQSIRSVQARVTWQMSPKNKLAVYNDRLLKNRGSAMTAGFDPATAGIVWNSPIYTTGSVKFTLDGDAARSSSRRGFSTNYERYNTLYQPGLEKEPFTPEWYTVINKKRQRLAAPQWNAGATNQGMYPDRFAAMGSVSYVTGAHNVKVGIQDTWGRYRQFRSANGDLRASLHQRRGDPGDDPEHAGELRGRPEGRPRHLRAGLVDDEPADPELRRALGVLRVGHSARRRRASAASCDGARPSVRSTCRPGRASRRAAASSTTCSATRRPRSSRASASTCRPARPASRTRYNPLALHDADGARGPTLNDDGIPQGELGCMYLTAPAARSNLAGQLPANFGVASLADLRSRHQADVQRRGDGQRPARDHARRLGDRAAGITASTSTCAGAPTPASALSDFTPFTLYSPIDGTPITYYNVSAAKASQLRHQPRRPERARPHDEVQRLRVQLQRASAARHHAVRRRHERTHAHQHLRRRLEPEPAAVLRSVAERPARSARSSRSPGSVPLKYGIQVGVAFQSLPGLRATARPRSTR